MQSDSVQKITTAGTTCRICFDVIENEESGVIPCECRDGGNCSTAHKACVQQWIDMRPNLPASSVQHKDLSKCEVCGTQWKQSWPCARGHGRCWVRRPGKRHPLVADGDDSLEGGSRFWPRSAGHQGKAGGGRIFRRAAGDFLVK